MKLGAKRIPWTDADDAFVRANYGQMSAAELGRHICRSEIAIWRRAEHLGLGKREERHDPWTEAELDEVRRCYSTESPASIAKRLNRTVSAVSQQAATLGMVSRKMLIAAATVHDYFSDVTTPEQAYLIGLLAADGNIASDHPRVIFGAQVKDLALVEFVRDRLNPRANLYFRPNNYAVLQVTSRQMVADLARYGVVPCKSRIIQWPRNLGALTRPYLLGYFDGDGAVFLPKGRNPANQYPGWTVCSGSEQFIVDLKAYVEESTGITMEKIHHRAPDDLWQVSTTGRGAFVLDEWLHQDQEGLGLARKRFPERVLARYR